MHIVILELPIGIGEVYRYARRRGDGSDDIRTGRRCHAGGAYAGAFGGVDLCESEQGSLSWVGIDAVLDSWWCETDGSRDLCGGRERECGANEWSDAIWSGCWDGSRDFGACYCMIDGLIVRYITCRGGFHVVSRVSMALTVV